jgi:hypothetical protein
LLGGGSVIIEYNGTSWEPVTDAMELNAVGFISATEGWAGTSNNNFVHYTNRGWIWDEAFVNANPMVITSIEKAGEGRLLLNGPDDFLLQQRLD